MISKLHERLSRYPQIADQELYREPQSLDIESSATSDPNDPADVDTGQAT